MEKTPRKPKPIPDYGDHMPMEEFINSCEGEFFIDYDGYGHPATEKEMFPDIYIYPSEIMKGKHREYTHIVWFNR